MDHSFANAFIYLWFVGITLVTKLFLLPKLVIKVANSNGSNIKTRLILNGSELFAKYSILGDAMYFNIYYDHLISTRM